MQKLDNFSGQSRVVVQCAGGGGSSSKVEKELIGGGK